MCASWPCWSGLAFSITTQEDVYSVFLHMRITTMLVWIKGHHHDEGGCVHCLPACVHHDNAGLG